MVVLERRLFMLDLTQGLLVEHVLVEVVQIEAEFFWILILCEFLLDPRWEKLRESVVKPRIQNNHSSIVVLVSMRPSH